MKSFGILRTNPGLTTNIKIVVDSGYKLSLDSIDSVPELSASKFKKVEFNKDNLYDDLIPYFYDGLPAELAFSIKYDNDASTMTKEFADQYDEIYQYGARNIINNKNYREEYEYFAPLYINKGNLPKYFVVFRVDGPGITRVDRSNFKSLISSNFKTVSLFDLTKKTALGEWFNKNIEENDFFPNTPFEMNYDLLEFSIWKGINYESGGYVERSQFLDDLVEQENEVFEMEKFVFDGYRNNKVVFPNILNMSFLFDDTPADENRLRKWSMNRYYGFYIEDIERKATISPYEPPALHTDVVVSEGNIISSASSNDPFVLGYKDQIPMYVEYEGEYYRVEKFKELLQASFGTVNKSTGSNTGATPTKGPNVQISTGNFFDLEDPTTPDYRTDDMFEREVEMFRIVSDIELSGKQAELNTNTGTINSGKLLVDKSGNPIFIQDFDRSDVWLIEIDGKYHNLAMSGGAVTIVSDYSFSFADNSFSYLINKTDPSFTTTVSTLVDFNNPPKKFSIYRVKFSSIKDFDTRIVDTEPSKFEYEKSNEITKTEETKLYFIDLNSTTIPQKLDNFYYKDEVVNIPVSSEYTANQETFKIDGGLLSQIWRKNPVYCRWAYKGSLSANDYPYTLNNSWTFEDFNRTTNTYNLIPTRSERNLDYFYTINSSTYSYSHHSLHVERSIDGGIDVNFDFDFDKYLGNKSLILSNNETIQLDFDYFNSIFTMKTSYGKGTNTKNTRKYSEFVAGDGETPNFTVFRGIKFSIYDVQNIKLNNNGGIETVNTTLNNTFEDYKFSILLTSIDNGMRWDIVEKWDIEKKFLANDIVVYDDILYQAVKDTACNLPSVTRTKTAKVNGVLTNSAEKVLPAPYNLTAYNLTDKKSPAGAVIFNGLQFDSNTPAINDWVLFNNTSDVNLMNVLWNPVSAMNSSGASGTFYKKDDVIYRHGAFYYMVDPTRPIDFWNPAVAMNVTTNANGVFQRTGYRQNNIVYHKGNFYKSKVDGNIKPTEDSDNWEKMLEQLNDFLKWRQVEVWQPNKQYGPAYSLVVHNGVLYKSSNNGELILSGTTPGTSIKWTRLYSTQADTDFVYSATANPLILHNGVMYRMISNPGNKTLENGVRIFINHRHKNVLVNIFVNDNTLVNLRNSDRDSLYNLINGKLVAKNFIDHINSISYKNEFSDNLTYIVISATGSATTYGYGKRITDMPHILFADGPEEIKLMPNSIDYIPSNQIRLKPTKTLKESRITSLTELNYFNNTHMGTEIVQRDDTPTFYDTALRRSIFRFGGNYTPVFTEIELFNKSNSVDYTTIDLKLEISDAQSVIFDISRDGSGSQSSYMIYPGKSYSTANQFWSQISAVMAERLPDVDFHYELRNKLRSPLTGAEFVSFDDTSYNEELGIWYDSGKSGTVARPVNTTATPLLVRTDLYPGNHFLFPGSPVALSFMRTSRITLATQTIAYEFIVKTNEVNRLNFFMGDGSKGFGFQDGRAFTIINTVTSSGSIKAAYSKKIIQRDTWYHIVFNYRKAGTVTSVEVWIDGRLMNETESLPSTSVSYTNAQTTNLALKPLLNSVMAIGTFKDFTQLVEPYDRNFSGSLALARIYNRSLNDKEIYESYVSGHRAMSVKYVNSVGDIKVTLRQEYPSLVLNISDTFDPLYPYFALQLGATGGNPPYEFSFNNGAFSSTTVITSIAKNGAYPIVVRDILGLTATSGYYLVNSIVEDPYVINGTLLY